MMDPVVKLVHLMLNPCEHTHVALMLGGVSFIETAEKPHEGAADKRDSDRDDHYFHGSHP